MSFDLGALLHLVGQNPGLAAQLDASGIPPPNDQVLKLAMGGGEGLGDMMKLGGPEEPAQTPPVPGVESPGTTQEPIGPWDATVNPVASPSKLGGPSEQAAGSSSNQLAALAGLKGVGQPVQPFTHGGVVGGVKAPERHPANPAVISGIIQMLMHPHASGVPQGPSLGSLIPHS